MDVEVGVATEVVIVLVRGQVHSELSSELVIVEPFFGLSGESGLSRRLDWVLIPIDRRSVLSSVIETSFIAGVVRVLLLLLV